MSTTKTPAATLAIACALIALAGCASLSQVRFAVKPSALDYVQLRRIQGTNTDTPPRVIRLELTGSGYLDYKSGRSVRVRDNFWQESNSENWRDLKSDHIVLSAEETLAFYQRFVDAGLFDQRTTEQQDSDAAALTIMGCIGFEKKIIFTKAPVYNEIFDELLEKLKR